MTRSGHAPGTRVVLNTRTGRWGAGTPATILARPNGSELDARRFAWVSLDGSWGIQPVPIARLSVRGPVSVPSHGWLGRCPNGRVAEVVPWDSYSSRPQPPGRLAISLADDGVGSQCVTEIGAQALEPL